VNLIFFFILKKATSGELGLPKDSSSICKSAISMAGAATAATAATGAATAATIPATPAR
jgi:hypothetical protein